MPVTLDHVSGSPSPPTSPGLDDSGLPEEPRKSGAPWRSQEDIVISGLSGRFPDSNNIKEFADSLFAGRDLVTDDGRRWEPGLYGLPRRNGKLPTWAKFDAQFFGVPPKQAIYMDPQVRTLLEVAYEAICDAGLDPGAIRGTRSGVFVGSSGSESMPALTKDPDLVSGYSMSGCAGAMFANRLSYAFDFRGPSFNVDTACNSSLLALQVAMTAMRDGQCELALVCGSNAVLTPTNALQFLRLGVLSPDGACKSFDANGLGYAKSEGVGVLVLQRRPAAHRVYATLVHAKSTTDGFKEEGVHFPSGERQAQLLREVYSECRVSPSQLAFMEAHGTGTKAGDPQEANAIADVFCPKGGRSGPLLIGSVKSNMGHAEPASGVASVAKVLIAMERGQIPPNLHFTEPNPEIPGLVDGRLSVVTKPTPWDGGYVGINSFGFGGANTHVLLHSHKAPMVRRIHDPDLPRMLCYSARTEDGLKKTLLTAWSAAQGPCGPWSSALLAAQANAPMPLPFRGFCLGEPTAMDPAVTIQKMSPGEKRPLWLVFTGMGAQWVGMARDLLARMPAFRASLKASARTITDFGCDVFELLLAQTEETYTNVRNSIVCNIAVQIALVDVLVALGVSWDGMVGHSTGEIACGYADGGLSRKQAMQMAFYRGQAIRDAELAGGAMAAVGLTWEEAEAAVAGTPVVAACHNAADSVTLSGPAADVHTIVDRLDKEGVFARKVESGGVAFHSPVLEAVRARLEDRFSAVIPSPKPRSAKWASTSANPDQSFFGECSAAYHVNSVMGKVRFHGAVVGNIPEQAITLEVGPHALLGGLLRRSRPEATHIGLMSRRAECNVDHLFSSLGKLYCAGAEVHAERLYPEPSWPAPLGTPMLSHLIAESWDHSADWPVMNGPNAGLNPSSGDGAGMSFTFDPFSAEKDDDAYLLHHQIDGRSIFPFTGYPVMAWKALCKAKGLDHEKTGVTFHDLRVFRPTLLTKAVKLELRLLPEEGDFEVTEGGSLVAAGRVVLDAPSAQPTPFYYQQLEPDIFDPLGSRSEEIVLVADDIYKELGLRGYEYGPAFRGLHSIAGDGSRGLIRWTRNWVTFLDALLQANITAEPKSDRLRLPVRLRYLRIDPQRHEAASKAHESGECVIEATIVSAVGGLVAGGVEMGGLVAQGAQRRLHSPALLIEKFQWIAYEDDACLAQLPQQRSDLLQAKEELDRCLSSLRSGVVSPPSGGASALVSALQGVDWTDAEAAAAALPELRRLAESDAYMGSAWAQRSFKVCLDLVTENGGGHERRCLGLGSELDAVVATAAGFQLSHPLATVAWTLGTPQTRAEGTEAPEAVDDERDLTLGAPLPEGLKPFELILLNRVLSASDSPAACLSGILDWVAPGGFVLVHELKSAAASQLDNVLGRCAHAVSHEDWLHVFSEAGAVLIAAQTDPAMPGALFLLRKPRAADRKPALRVSIDDLAHFSWVPQLQAALEDPANEDRSIVLTSTTRDNGGVGLTNCFREEFLHTNRIRNLVDVSLSDAEPVLPLDSAEVWSGVEARDVLQSCWRNGRLGSMRPFIVREGQTHVRRPTAHAFISNLVHGDLSSMTWVQSPLADFRPRTADTQLVNIYFASLNFRDVMLATGRLSRDSLPGNYGEQDCILGSEFAGRVTDSGRRVMGTGAAQALATSFASQDHFLYDVPAKWSLEDAATVPVVYCTALYALNVRGRLRRGERVLIHSGSGGVGQAAIAICLHHGCEVFTTVGSPEKRAFLRHRFPALQDHHISNSRSTDFELDVMRQTKGRGVDVVLNSLAEDKLQASVRCLARHGRFLEIGKFDMANNSELGMAVFLKNIEFHGILLDAVETKEEWLELKRLLEDGIASGMVKPLPRTIFASEAVEDAFRFMAQGKHIGKVVVQIRSDVTDAPPVEVLAVSRTYCDPDHSFLITGGLGGFGLELATWLVHKGARHLILTSRSGLRSSYQKRSVAALQALGAEVLVSTLDVGEEDQCRSLISECQALGPVGGIFHLAMVLRDSMFENQTVGNFTESARTKYWGTRHLDTASRGLCGTELRWFICFSSVSSGRGNLGQTNYGWANSTMERICELRQAAGLPGQAVMWGAIGDVGVILSSMGDNNTVVGGTLPQRIPSCMSTLEEFLGWKEPVVSSLVRAETGNRRGDGSGGDVVETIAKIIGISDLGSLDEAAPLGDLGLDSLMGMEIKQAIERDAGIILSMKEIQSLTMAKLKQMIKDGHSDAALPADGEPQTMEGLKEQMLTMFKLRIEPNDSMASEALVRLNSVKAGTPLFFVHTMEGIASPLRTLGALIDVPAFCLQCTPDTPLDSIPAMAKHYLKIVQATAGDGVQIRLAGYSYGACIAFEMATLLEAEGAPSPTLVLLDSSHQYMSAYKKLYRAVYNLGASDSLSGNVAFETELVCQLSFRFASFDTAALHAACLAAPSWTARVDAAAAVVLPGGLFSDPAVFRWLADSVKARYVAADQYSPSRNIHGDVTLIRAHSGTAKEEDVGYDYGLNDVVLGKVNVSVVEGDHEALAQKSAALTAAIINDLL